MTNESEGSIDPLNNVRVILMSQTELSNTMYDILHAMGKDARFLYTARTVRYLERFHY